MADLVGKRKPKHPLQRLLVQRPVHEDCPVRDSKGLSPLPRPVVNRSPAAVKHRTAKERSVLRQVPPRIVPVRDDREELSEVRPVDLPCVELRLHAPCDPLCQHVDGGIGEHRHPVLLCLK